MWRPKPNTNGIFLKVKKMKRRANYILDRIINDSNNQDNDFSNHSVHNVIMETPIINSKKKTGADGDIMNNNDEKYYIAVPSLSHKEYTDNFSVDQNDQIVTESTPEDEIKSSAHSSSIDEKSPDRKKGKLNTDKENIVPSCCPRVKNPDTLFLNQQDQIITKNTPENENKSSTPCPSEKDKSTENSPQLQESITTEQPLLPDNIGLSRSRNSSPSSDCSSSSSSSSSSCSSSSTSCVSKSNVNSNIDGPSTSQVACRVTSKAKRNYHQSPINSNESDVDLSDSDPTYVIDRSRSNVRKTAHNILSSRASSSPSSHNKSSVPEATRKSRKRTRDPSKWRQNVAKILRNSGKAYVSLTSKKEVPARFIKNACKCRLKCSENINDVDRNTLFESYWSLGNIELQRSYIRSCMMEVKPRYKYTNAAKPRQPNNAFYFRVSNTNIRVCKTFFINTLGICDRQIRTVKKKTDPQGFITKDIRGKHLSRKPTDPLLIESIKTHINSIPRIESHYLRASTSREYISSDKKITDLWKDFDAYQKKEGKPTCDYWLYYDIFNKEFNIGFFQPKKDRCDLCLDFELANTNRKIEIKEKYEGHLKEKDLCRQEKRLDRQNIDETNVCVVYDLQAVMQCPTGETSAFFYKSKLNCLNFTIVELLKKSEALKKPKNDKKQNDLEIGAYSNVYSYFWDEVQGKRGANEIGSCILDYLKRLNDQNPNKNLHVTFYSDNCCGQNKNKFIASLYSYAVARFENIHTITHKYLIKGHTQNEGDNVHSLIEKEIKKNKLSGPIYAPYQYVTLIKNSRKNGKPFNVKELTYDFLSI